MNVQMRGLNGNSRCIAPFSGIRKQIMTCLESHFFDINIGLYIYIYILYEHKKRSITI